VITMTKPLLVVYATKHESTKEVARAVASRLEARGHRAELRPAADVETLGGYDGVILGGALYAGRWHRDARRFLSRHRGELAALPFAVFAMGPLTLDEGAMADSRKQLDRALAHQPTLEPIAVAVFGGVIDPEKLRFPFSHMEAADARDWDAIRCWTDDVAGPIERQRIPA
jgi:menaquinone-dependent protoporphyrinogen oxidase